MCHLFCNDPAPTEIYTYLHTLSLHGALPICPLRSRAQRSARKRPVGHRCLQILFTRRSEEHTSELQSLMRISYAVFCLKKKKLKTYSCNIYIQPATHEMY